MGAFVLCRCSVQSNYGRGTPFGLETLPCLRGIFIGVCFDGTEYGVERFLAQAWR